MHAIVRSVVDFVYPPFCTLCSARTDRGPGPHLCNACRDEFRPESSDWCQRCGAPVGPHLDTAAGCVHCRGDRFAFVGVRALGVYTDRLAAACRLGKAETGAALVAGLAGLLLEVHRAWFDSIEAAVVLPVPKHWTQRWATNHDAARVAARTLSRGAKFPIRNDVLLKVRRTRPQSSLTATERRRNLRRAFAVHDRSAIKGRRVLLVDDVLTTGTTAQQCTRTLLAAGAESVHVAVLARGIGV